MASKRLNPSLSSPQGTDELETQGLWLEREIQSRLGSVYSVRRNNPNTLGWSIYQNEHHCGGFTHLAGWVYVYAVCDAPSGDVAFVKNAIEGAIESLGGAK